MKLALMLSTAVLAGSIGQGAGQPRAADAYAHLRVGLSVAATIAPTVAVIAQMDLPDDAISREIAVAIAVPDPPDDGAVSREISVALGIVDPPSGSANSREVSVGLLAESVTFENAASREIAVEWNPDKPFFAQSREISVGGVRGITIQVQFQDIDPGFAPSTVEVLMTDADGTIRFDQTVGLANQQATIPGMPRAYLNAYVRSSHWLRRRETIGPSESSMPFSLINGDCDQDNEVGIGDYAVLSFAYGSEPGAPNWFADADLNGDESVDIADYAILSYNYGQSGD